MSFIQYLWDVLSWAFSGAWAVANAVSFILSILFGIIVWKRPPKEPIVKNLMWIIPLGIFAFCLIGSVFVYAPYKIHYKDQQQISKLQSDLTIAQKQAFATPDALTSPLLQNMNIRINDLAREDQIIRNKTFDNCHIYGPSVVICRNCLITNAQFIDEDPNGIFIETKNNVACGAIELNTCVAKNCFFYKISLIGVSDDRNRITGLPPAAKILTR